MHIWIGSKCNLAVCTEKCKIFKSSPQNVVKEFGNMSQTTVSWTIRIDELKYFLVYSIFYFMQTHIIRRLKIFKYAISFCWGKSILEYDNKLITQYLDICNNIF